MLQRLFVDNYKCLVNFELRFDEISLLLGPNGSGKSTVLGVISALRKLVRGEAKVTDGDVFPTSTLTRWQEREIQSFELRVAAGDDLFDYRLDVEHNRRTGQARIVKESLQVAEEPLFAFEKGVVRLYRDDHSQGPSFSSDSGESALARVVPQDDNKRLSRFVDFVRGSWSVRCIRLHSVRSRRQKIPHWPTMQRTTPTGSGMSCRSTPICASRSSID